MAFHWDKFGSERLQGAAQLSGHYSTDGGSIRKVTKELEQFITETICIPLTFYKKSSNSTISVTPDFDTGNVERYSDRVEAGSGLFVT